MLLSIKSLEYLKRLLVLTLKKSYSFFRVIRVFRG